ncbi:MAG: phosphoribosyl-ATP diphosphatase [Candidatus Nanopelagicales bacterium]|nr:phosphoribosyl-ATP diphosphatase [Actinomycetes bacterium]MCH9830339.1 phosphoribosyl-ATP diphosphatase [Actinomycetes bacterium]MCH9839977.1 phosphoribosyl-ATP diphosphatase [Actinomycetes bacterium]
MTQTPPGKSFEDLYLELSDKIATGDTASGSVRLLQAGSHEIGKKIVEEAAEVWMAAEYEGNEALALEISQLIYHVQLLMLANNVSMADVYKNL